MSQRERQPPTADDLILRAARFAQRAHVGQKRKRGGLYVAESILLVRRVRDADPELVEELFGVVEELGFPRDHAHPKTETSGLS